MLEIICPNTTAPAVCEHSETVNRDGGTVCFNCGKRMERQPEQTDAPALTLADVLQKTAATVEDNGYSLAWDDRHAWVIYNAAGDRVFSSPDQSAACAEFLRLTGGES